MNPTTHPMGGHPGRLGRWLVALSAFLFGGPAKAQPADPSPFPTLPPEHRHARLLLANALRYVDPENHLVDPVSGYPVEGWNQDPSRGLFLRSFTQLTAIGQYMELLANVVAGRADTPQLSRDQAQAQLVHLVATLRKDQQDPSLAAKGLLGNFLDVATGKRLGPLASDVDKSKIIEAFGPIEGVKLWKALIDAGWIAPRNKDQEAEIRRGARYGSEYFDGPLAPFASSKSRVMALLDRRVVMAILGDNANLSASVAKTIGALISEGTKGRVGLDAIRDQLEGFLEAQRDGYAHLHDPSLGLFYFGWDATKDRLFGWEDLQGNWTTGHLDYLVNEFRGPATFVAVRFGLPGDAIGNLGFKIKPYRMADGRELYTLAPWEGSAFQALGLSIAWREPTRSGWGELLRNVVAIEDDYARRHALPGFLSESYTGDGVQYTGSVGIPSITVSPRPRIVDAASLYTLGAAYSVDPGRVEAFLASAWPGISSLFTEHGPWEGFNVARREPIRFQTTAHTLALILGLLNRGSEDMARYLESKGDSARLEAFFRPASMPIDLMAKDVNVFAWSPKGDALRSGREGSGFAARGDRVEEFGIAFIPPGPDGVDLSGGHLVVRYRAAIAVDAASIQLKPKGRPSLIPKEIAIHFEAGGDKIVRVPLPEMPGLHRVGEVVITRGPDPNKPTLDLTITGLGFEPAPPSKPKAGR